MIIRRLGSTDLLISQPEHAALAGRILRQWHLDHFPDSPRKASILRAIEEHDCGWREIDKALVVDEATGQLLDFVELPDEIKRETARQLAVPHPRPLQRRNDRDRDRRARDRSSVVRLRDRCAARCCVRSGRHAEGAGEWSRLTPS